MANLKRRFKWIHGHRESAMARIKRTLPYSTLSDVEDRSDRGFLVQIAQMAAANAINENKAMNIPVTVLEGDWVVRKKMDGTTYRIAKIEQRDDAEHAKILKGAILRVKNRR